MKHYISCEEFMKMVEAEIKENHPHIATDQDKYAVGYHNGLTMAKAIARKSRKEIVHCEDCVFYKKRVCIRKVKCGGAHAVDQVRPNFYCAAGKRRKENDT